VPLTWPYALFTVTPCGSHRFNLENLFDRAKAFNEDTIAEGKVLLDKFGELNKLFAKSAYSNADKNKILNGLDELVVLERTASASSHEGS
jgi:hypothetical protein